MGVESKTGIDDVSTDLDNKKIEIPRAIAVYDPSIPIVTGPGITPGSYGEALAISKALVGRWSTVLHRSDHLCSHYKHLGLNVIKRSVIKRIPVPLTAFLEHNDTVLHIWVHTPLGKRHLTCNITGAPASDVDPDCGAWTGTTGVVDYTCPWFEGGRTFRALQQVRTNPKYGTAVETRCVLPDTEFGRIMLFNYTIIPLESDKSRLSGDRVLKFNAG